MEGRSRQRHMVMLPFMAQGHIIPFLALAKHIDERYQGSYAITLVNTPLNIRNLHSIVPPNSNIRLRELPFSSSDHGLPPDSENTDSLTTSQLLRLIESSASLQPQFDRLISDVTREYGDAPPLCIIADVFFGWSVVVARRHGVFHAAFTTCGAYGTAAYFCLWLHLPHAHTDSEEFLVPGFPETFRLHRSQLSRYLRAADGKDPWSKFFHRQLPLTFGSNGMLCNTAEEVETMGVRLLQKNTGLQVWTIGPLLPKADNSSQGRVGKKPGIELETCIRWLDSYPPDSVVYVSFGSMNTISESQMMNLAMGLEASGHPFVWVVRPPIGSDINGDFGEKWLPHGFEKRVTEKKQGILVRKWAPQLEILSHRSVGGFLSHCGWNSVLESLSRGVPIIAWPLAAEQFYNSLMLEEEMGVGIELARGTESEVCSRDVERVVALAMRGEEGEQMKRRAAAIAETMKAAMREHGDDKGASLKALDDFLRSAITKEMHI